MTRWWKCDLQVATPGEPRFDRCSTSWDLREQGGERLPPTTTCEPSWQQEWR